MSGSDAHGRIILGIERAVPPEYFHGDRICLNSFSSTGQAFPDHVVEKSMISFRRAEIGAFLDTQKLLAAGLVGGPHVTQF
ncbi:hypothetical protein HFO37_35765 [Rhizobium leguminosarum]|nr:hypothetical protein [Rhizobium leguminosarum]